MVQKTHIYFKKLSFTLFIFMSFFITQSWADISTTDRCKATLGLMGVDASGTNRGWAALCAGAIEGDSILRYGNWYGPKYWGGGTDIDKPGYKAPVDSLDEIAMRHDYGYVIAEKYGKIYGKAYEYKLKAIADKIAVEESMELPKDPTKWDKPPKNPVKTARYRDRIITGFIMESDLYVLLDGATMVNGVVSSPITTILDETDYSHIPNEAEFKRELKSHINGWHKDAKKEKEIAKQKELERKEALEKKIKKIEEQKKKEFEKKLMKKLKAESDAKRYKDAKEVEEAKARLREKIEEDKKNYESELAKERLRKKIKESKEEQKKKKSYEEMTPEERKKALMQNDDEAWNAIKKELTGEETGEANEVPPVTSSDIPVIKLYASGSFDEDYSSGGFTNIVTTTITLSFYNVGSQVPGYGSVSMNSKSVSSLNGSTAEGRCGGSFSGGPNGAIKLSGDCAGMVLYLKSGSTIKFDAITLTLSNPAAFSYWDK